MGGGYNNMPNIKSGTPKIRLPYFGWYTPEIEFLVKMRLVFLQSLIEIQIIFILM